MTRIEWQIDYQADGVVWYAWTSEELRGLSEGEAKLYLKDTRAHHPNTKFRLVKVTITTEREILPE